MFLEFIYPLHKVVSFFNIFKYITFRSAYALITALFIWFLFGKAFIKYLKKIKQASSVREDVPQRHLSKSDTPSMGGVLIVIAVLISVALWGNFRNIYTIISIVSIIGFGLIGFIDDYLKNLGKRKGLRAKYKMLLQLIFASTIISIIYYTNDNNNLTKFYIPFYSKPLFDMGWYFIPFGTIVIVASSNAVNLTDGLDGLAAGLSIFVLIAFAVFSYVTGHLIASTYLKIPYIKLSGELSVVISAMIGSVIGFLWYNSHPAEVFMGDTGSLSIGSTIGLVSVLTKNEMLLFIVGGIFVIEALSVIIQVFSFKTRGKRVFRMTPIHHHFELGGISESKIVIRFWIIGGILALIALSTLKIR